MYDIIIVKVELGCKAVVFQGKTLPIYCCNYFKFEEKLKKTSKYMRIKKNTASLYFYFSFGHRPFLVIC